MRRDHRTFASADDALSGGLVAIQVSLLVVGIVLFLWLINVVALNGDWLPDLFEALSVGVWTAILVSVLALIFIGELVLFFFQRSE